MHVRDAVEDDAEALATRAELPAEAVRQLIHDRTVRIVERPDGDEESDSSGDGGTADGEAPSDEPTPCGFLAFDADEGAVHVTQVDGDRDAVGTLLEEPLRFAAKEGMPVEILVPDTETTVLEAVEEAGFESVGDGPRFDGQPVRRYRLETG